MAKLELQASSRNPGKKGAARKLRAAGSIPCVVYGHNVESLSVSVDPAALNKVLSTDFGANIVFDVVVDNDKHYEVMIKSAQRDPVTRRILHADFYAVDPERKVQVRVPLELTGKAAGVGLGGRLRKAARDVVVTCLPKDIPTVVPFDVTPMGLRDRAQISAVPRPANTEFVYGSDFLVAEIIPPRS